MLFPLSYRRMCLFASCWLRQSTTQNPLQQARREHGFMLPYGVAGVAVGEGCGVALAPTES